MLGFWKELTVAAGIRQTAFPSLRSGNWGWGCADHQPSTWTWGFFRKDQGKPQTWCSAAPCVWRNWEEESAQGVPEGSSLFLWPSECPLPMWGRARSGTCRAGNLLIMPHHKGRNQSSNAASAADLTPVISYLFAPCSTALLCFGFRVWRVGWGLGAPSTCQHSLWDGGLEITHMSAQPLASVAVGLCCSIRVLLLYK